jgi:hypothetical protein
VARADDIIKALQILAPYNDSPHINGADHDIIYLFSQPDPALACTDGIAIVDPDQDPEDYEEFGVGYVLKDLEQVFWGEQEVWCMYV